jgi:drug/metabolite transporter (DMT)-like permease
MAAVGVIMVVSKGEWHAIPFGNFGTPGDRLILLSAPNWAIFSVLSRRGLKKLPAALMMFYVMAFGWLFTNIQFFYTTTLKEFSGLRVETWLAISFLGIVCSGTAYIFWYDGLKDIPASHAGAFLYLEPIITMFISAFVLQELIATSSIIGGAIILIGVWLVNRPNTSFLQTKEGRCPKNRSE